MADLYTLVQQMGAQDGYFAEIARDRRAQFGPRRRQYLGATILPEQNVEQNAYREQDVRYRTVIANDGSRYSPAQKKKTGELVGSFLVELGHQDIAVEMTGRDYDALIALLRRNDPMEAMARIISWSDTAGNRALVELTEKQRWEAIVNASVQRVGDNGQIETVTYPNPAGHRVNAGGAWSNDSYDPYNDIKGVAQVLFDKGYEITGMYGSRRVGSILTNNDKMAARANKVKILSTTELFNRATMADLSNFFAEDGLPAIETYDLLYRTQTGSGRFMPDDCLVFVCASGRDETIDWGDGQRFIPDTLGYTAIGRAVGQQSPGRVLQVEPKRNKPPRLELEAWQTSLPVITEPEAIAVIRGIN